MNPPRSARPNFEGHDTESIRKSAAASMRNR
jgi:hypothetical protein